MNRAVLLVQTFTSPGSFLAGVVENGVCVDAVVGFLSVEAIADFPLVIGLRFNSDVVTWAAADEVIDAVAAAVQVVLLVLAAINFTAHCSVVKWLS